MAIFTIAGLTLKEAWRRRTLLGACLLGLLVLALSLTLMLIRARFTYLIHVGRWSPGRFATEYVHARILITLMCLFFIRILGLLFAILLAGGAVSGEIEQGLLSVILSKPIPRWHILAGKWLGLNLIAIGSIVLWTALVWLSLRLQTHVPLEQILAAAPYLALYPVLVCTLTLTLSTVYQRVLGTSIALIMTVFSWSDGIFNFLGDHFNVPALHTIADIGGLLMPQGYIAWWIRDTLEDITPNPLGDSPVHSSRLLAEWGQAHLHFAHLDGLYVALYIAAVLLIGAILLQRREIT